MRLAVVVAILLCGLIGALAVPTQLNYRVRRIFLLASFSLNGINYFQLGQKFAYKLNANLDARGQSSARRSGRSDGTVSKINAVVAMKCVEVHPDFYILVMNLYDTQVGVGGLEASETQLYSSALGPDVHFKQMKNGEIPTIWFYEGDSPYFVEVKLGAINAFQTRFVDVGRTVNVRENDPVGSHNSRVSGRSGSRGSTAPLVLTKTFTQVG